jgi:hypothetical protein
VNHNRKYRDTEVFVPNPFSTVCFCEVANSTVMSVCVVCIKMS